MDSEVEHPAEAVARACPVCGATKAEVLHRQCFAIPLEFNLPDVYDVVCCERCGMVYADTTARQDDYDAFYRDLSRYDTPGLSTGGGDTPLDRARLVETAEFLAKHLPDQSAPLLDVGCGNGGLLTALAEVGFDNLEGLDPSPNCACNVRAAGFRATVGSLSSADEKVAGLAGRFQYAVLSHVLEHLCDLRVGFESVVSLVRPGGFIWVEVPDASRYVEHDVVPFYYFDIEHINHFDAESLHNLAAESGLGVVATARKTISVSRDVLYPAVGVLMSVPNGARACGELRPARSARMSVQEYVRRSRERDRWEVLERVEASGGAPVAVWGAGSFAQRLMATSPLGRCNVVAFVDNDLSKQGTRLAGRAVHEPAWLKGFDGVIVVAAAFGADAILNDISALGLPNKVLVVSGRK